MEVMGFNVAMVAANITTCNEEDEAMFNRLNKEVQGPGFFVIIAGNSADDFAFKKKVLETIVAEADGLSLKSVEDPEIEGILLTQCTRISGSIRETFRPGGYFKSIPIMGQRDLTIQMGYRGRQGQAAAHREGPDRRRRRRLLRMGRRARPPWQDRDLLQIQPDESRGLEGRRRLVLTPRATGRVDEKYFALTMAEAARIDSTIGPALSNYHVWWNKFLDSFDPNGVIPKKGISKLSAVSLAKRESLSS